MKKFLLILLGSITAMTAVNTSNANEVDNIKETITNFANYDNAYNADGLSEITDESFHFMMYSGPENESITTIPKSGYIGGIKAKKFGGNDKALEIKSVHVQGNVANVYFTHMGEKLGFHHFMNLIKLNGEWKAASTAVHMEFF